MHTSKGKFIAGLLLMSSSLLAARPAKLQEMNYRPVNGGFNPDYLAYEVTGVVTVPNSCWTAKLSQVKEGADIDVFAEAVRMKDIRFCAQALRDIKVSTRVSFNKYETNTVTIKDVESKGDVVIFSANNEAETVPTQVRDALVTVDEKGNIKLTARLFQGSNPCVASGVKVGWKEIRKGNKTIIEPHKTKSEARICTREYRPVYHELSTVIQTPLESTFLANFQGEKRKRLTEIKALLLARTYGGFCMDRCPETTVAVTADGKVSKFVKRTSWDSDEETHEFYSIATLSKTAVKAIESDISYLKEGELLDSNPEDPYCADIPMVEFTATQGVHSSILFHREVNCHDYDLERSYVSKNLTTILKSFKILGR